MPLQFHQVGNFNQLIRQLIRAGEGPGPLPYNAGDHTITMGYGYTLVRSGTQGWEPYENLVDDLRAIGILAAQSDLGRIWGHHTQLDLKAEGFAVTSVPAGPWEMTNFSQSSSLPSIDLSDPGNLVRRRAKKGREINHGVPGNPDVPGNPEIAA